MDKTLRRTVAWLGVASGLSFLVAPNFLPLLNKALENSFGTFFPAIPFVVLLTVLFLLRWGDLREILATEGGPASDRIARIIGLVIVASLLFLSRFTRESVELSGVAIILAVYGTSLILNPQTKWFMLPYAAIYIMGVTAPAIIEWSLGEPLAGLSSALSAGLVAFSGIPVVWHGAQFTLASTTGDVVSATITPGCSSVISVTTFLGLLGLMHIDMRKEASSTVKLAVAGTMVLTLLNVVRIVILIWVGYANGEAALWGIHNWVGYGLFLGFYLVALPVYARMGKTRGTTRFPAKKLGRRSTAMLPQR